MTAQLATRDSEQVNYESGLVILPEMDQAMIRHMADKTDHVYTAFPVNMSIDYRESYVMRLLKNSRDTLIIDNVAATAGLLSASPYPHEWNHLKGAEDPKKERICSRAERRRT